jgi:hypothetical protein
MTDLERKIDALNFGIEKSLRYHQRRRAFYEGGHRWAMFGVIILGSAAFGTIQGLLGTWSPIISSFAALLAAVLAAADLVFDLSTRARDHLLLHRSYSDLASDIRTKQEPTQDAYQSWLDRRIKIEAEEPPIYWALEASCDNEVTSAWDRDKKHGLVPLTRWQRLMMNFLTFHKVEFAAREIPPSSLEPPPPSASSGATHPA